MNAVGKKTKLSRDFRNNYAQKARFEDGNIWLEPVKKDQGRDRLHTTRSAETRPAPKDETNNKKQDRLHATRRAETDQEARDEINTRPRQREKQENTIKD